MMVISSVIATAAIGLGLLAAPIAKADTLYAGGTGAGSTTTGPTNLNWANHGGPATQVGYPATLNDADASIDQGVGNVLADIGPNTHEIVGVSQGAVVTNEVKRRLDADPNAPKNITFVQIADPTSKYGIMGRNPGLYVPGINLTFTGPVESKYTTEVISRQYDGVADWPAQQWNLLADLNAVMGIGYLHPNYGNIDLSGVTPEVDGNTTYYRIPTVNLPILQPLRDMGVDTRLVDAIQGVLKPMVDAGYRESAPRAVSRGNMAKPQAVTGSHTSNHKRRSCARLVVCAG